MLIFTYIFFKNSIMSINFGQNYSVRKVQMFFFMFTIHLNYVTCVSSYLVSRESL